MPTEITADAETLMRQAGHTAQYYMRRGRDEIDEMFGHGFSAKNPGLLAAFMQCAATDYQAAMIGIAGQHIRDAIRDRK